MQFKSHIGGGTEAANSERMLRLSALLLVFTACSPALESSGPSGDKTDTTGAPPVLVPVLIDNATREWATQQDSTLTGETIGVVAPGFREVYGELHLELTRQEARAVAYSVSFGASSEDHPATQFLAEAFSSSRPITAILASANPSPSVYASAEVGHGEMKSISFKDQDGAVQLQLAAALTGQAQSSLPVLAHQSMLMAAGASPSAAHEEARVGLQCAATQLEDDEILIAVDFRDVGALSSLPGLDQETRSLVDEVASLDGSGMPTILPSVSALDLLTGNAELPPNALIFVSDSKDVLEPVDSVISWNAPAAVLNARIAAQTISCGK